MVVRVILPAALIALLAGPMVGYADTLYVQELDNSGTTALGHGAFAPIVGTFTLSATSTIASDAYANFVIRSNSLPNPGTAQMYISSGVSCGSAGVSFIVDLPPADGQWHFFATTTVDVGVELPPGPYIVCVDNTSIFNSTDIQSNVAGTQFYGVIQNGGDGPILTATRIISVTPPGGTTIATSSTATVGALVNINALDWTHSNFDWYVLLSVVPSSALSGGKNFVFPINSEGLHSFSTTTDLLSNGVYLLTAQIKKPSFVGNLLGFWGFGGSFGVIVGTTTTFTVGQPSAFDNFVSSTTDAFSDFLTTASTTATLSDCGSLFKISQCVAYFVQPQSASISQFNGLGATLARKPPFGYWTAVKDVLATSTASTTPSVTLMGATTVAVWLAPLIAGLSDLILLLLAVGLFRRISHWEW